GFMAYGTGLALKHLGLLFGFTVNLTVMSFILPVLLAWCAVGYGGQVLPRVHSAQVGYLPAFLCGVCMFSPCSQGVSSTKNPNRKNMQNNIYTIQHSPVCPLLDLVPGRLKAAHCSWGVLEEGRSRMGKSRK